MKNLFYMAKPNYGGWVTFTVHLSKKFNFELYKVSKKTEYYKDGRPRLRNFGYDVRYHNISKDEIRNKNNILITAIDKNYYQYLKYFPDNTFIVIHDPTEVKGKSCQELIDNLSRFRIITIRKTVKHYLKNKLDLESIFLYHPFYSYIKTESCKTKTVSISRLDFDKHTDLIIRANKLLSNDKKIDIYGAKNDLYIYHHLTKKLNLALDNYCGTFKKSFSDLNNILSVSKFVIDLSAIKYDGGGSQYTFLEAIYQDCILILNKKWIENNSLKIESPFKHLVNCIFISDYNQLVNVLLDETLPIKSILKNSKLLLKPHLDVDWLNI